MSGIAITLICVAGLLVVWFIVTGNSLIARRNRVKQCQSGICVALKQRNDMIPNLVSSVRAYMGHESEVLTKVTELRTRAEGAQTEAEQIAVGNELTRVLGRLKVAVESYPDLKANQQFKQLNDAIEEMEYQLQAIRRTYNAAVISYNNAIEMFPSSIVAGARGHRQAELIDIPEAEKQNVNIGQLFNL